jgi:multiple sugar transport system substrate-binding protein
MIHLRGIAWDHPRCTLPLEASLVPWRERCPDVEVTWERRSLFSFGEGHIEDQAAAYDLIIYDHPFVGQVAESALMLDLSRVLAPDAVDELRAESLGPSFQSYEWAGGLWALPLDAASQVSAYRPDVVEEPPRSLDEVEALAARLGRKGLGTVTPLKQIDVFCLLLTLAASLGHPVQGDDPEVMADAVWDECLALLRRLHRLAVPGSERMNPIEAFDLMAHGNSVAYAPYLFGYSNYARTGPGAAGGRLVLAADMPGAASTSPAGSCIGGAGLGVSAQCGHPEEAAAYARFLCEPATQAGLYVLSGGQPAARSAWVSEAANATASGFFGATLATLDSAYLRPRFPGFMEAARAAGPRLVAHLAEDADAAPALAGLRAAFRDGGAER